MVRGEKLLSCKFWGTIPRTWLNVLFVGFVSRDVELGISFITYLALPTAVPDLVGRLSY